MFFLALAISSSNFNSKCNQYVKVVYFGVACPNPITDISKYHKLGNLNNKKIYFLALLEAEIPRSEYSMGGF